MSLAVELKRTTIGHWTLDIGWRKNDLIFHFYGPTPAIDKIDEKLDPVFSEIFQLKVIDKNKLIVELDNKILKENIKSDVVENALENAKILSRYKEINNLPGIHKAWTHLPANSIYHKIDAELKSWAYTVKEVDRMFLDMRVERLFKELSDVLHPLNKGK